MMSDGDGKIKKHTGLKNEFYNGSSIKRHVRMFSRNVKQKIHVINEIELKLMMIFEARSRGAASTATPGQTKRMYKLK